MNVSAEQLAAELLDDLDAGPAGVYELRWIAQSIEGHEISSEEPKLRAALAQVLASSNGRLAWVNWPGSVLVREEDRKADDLPSEVWNDPVNGQPYLAVMPP